MMWTREPACEREGAVRNLARSDVDDPELRAHAASCPACRETLAVASWMQDLAGLPIEASSLPSATHLWWKAQVIRTWDAQRESVAPLDVGERVQVGLGVIGALVLLVWLWRQVQPLATSAAVPATLTVVMIAGAVMLVAAAAIAARELIASE